MATQFSESDGRAWKRSFFTVWGGQAISLLGSQLVQFALIWHLTIVTGSATALAMASLVGLLPQVVIGPIIGSLVDRWDRRRIMLWADFTVATATLLLAYLFASGFIQIWHIYALMFVRSVGGGFHQNSMTASTSLMVPKEQMTRIQGLNQTLNGGLNIVSAPLGALLIETMQLQYILAIDVATAIFAITPLLFIRIPQPARIESGESQKTSMWADIAQGFRYVVSWPGLLIIIIMATLINFLLTPASALMPLLVRAHFGGGALELGWLEASFGIGVIIGGVGLGVWGGFKRRAATAMAGITGVGLGFLIFGATPPDRFWWVLAASVLAGSMLPITNGAIGAIMQSAVDPNIQGRVFTLVSSAAMLMSPIGLIIAGPVADAWGIQTWYWLGGAACVLLGVGGFFLPPLMNIEENNNGRSKSPAETSPAVSPAID